VDIGWLPVARNPGLIHNPGFSPARHEAPNMDLNKETLGPSRLEDAAKTQRPAPGSFTRSAD
jgi:hypothetical protein